MIEQEMIEQETIEQETTMERVKYRDNLDGKELKNTIVEFNSGYEFKFKEESPENTNVIENFYGTGLTEFLDILEPKSQAAIPLVSSNQLDFSSDKIMATVLVEDFEGFQHKFNAESLASELDFSIPKAGSDWVEVKEIFKSCFDLAIATLAKEGKVKFILNTGKSSITSKDFMYSSFEDLEGYFTEEDYLRMLSNIDVSGKKSVEILNGQDIKPIDLGEHESINFYEVIKNTMAGGQKNLAIPNLRPHFEAIEKWGEKNDKKFKIYCFYKNKIEFMEDTGKTPDAEDLINTWDVSWTDSVILPTYTISHRLTRYICSNGTVTSCEQLKNILSDGVLKENTKASLLPYLKKMKVKRVTQQSINNLEKQKPFNLELVTKEYKNMFKVRGELKLGESEVKNTFKEITQACSKAPKEITNALLEQILLTSRGLLEEHEKVENLYDCLNLITFLMQSDEMHWSAFSLTPVTNAFTSMIVGDSDEGYFSMLYKLGLENPELEEAETIE